MSRPLRLLFVCSGNICRSPMAEVLAEARGDAIGLPVEARSAGTLGLIDRPADPKAVAVCRERGLDLSTHRSQGLTPELLAWADHIIVMEQSHAAHLREYYDVRGDKILPLGPFGGYGDIPDPIGGWTFTFRWCRRRLEASLDGLLRRLAR